MSESLGSAVLILDANQGPLDAKLSAAQAATEGRLASMGARMKSVGSKLTSTGRGLTTKLTLPIVAAGAAIIAVGSKFEESMSKIVGLVGVSEKQVDGWGKQILQLAPKVKKSPNELAEAMFFVASAGFRGKEALDVLRASAEASTGGLGETKVIADAVTSAINAYGKGNLSASAATDVLTAAVKEGKLEASELAPVLGKILPTAAALHISFADAAGALAVFSKTGMDAAEGSTSLVAVMSALIKPAQKGEEALDSVGLSYSDLRDRVAQPGGVIDVMRLLKTRFHGNIEEMAKVVPNVRALRAVMNVLSQDGKEVDHVMHGVANSTGATSRSFKEGAKDGAAQMRGALASVEVGLIRLYDVIKPIVIPAIKSIGEAIGRAAQWFSRLSPSAQKIGLILIAVAAAAGPVLTILGGIATAIGTLLSPAAAVVLGIGALVAVFVYLYTTSSSVRGAVSNLVGLLQTIGQAVAPVAAALGGLALKILAFGLGLAGTRAGVVVLGAVLGALLGRMIALGAVWAVGKVIAFASAVATVVSEVRTAVAAVGVFRAAAMALSATISGSLVATGIGALLVVAGTVVGGLMGMSSATDHAKTSADPLTQSLQSEADALREVHDLSLELAQRKANLTAANLAVARAQQRVNEMQKSGKQGTLSYREAENGLTQAKIQQKRASNEVARASEDEAATQRKAAAAKREAVKQGEERIKGLIEEKGAVIASIATEGDSAAKRKQLATVNQGLSRTTDELGQALGHVPKKAQELANSLGRIPKKKKTEFELKDHNSAHTAKTIVSKVSSTLGGLKPKMSAAGRDGSNSLRGGLLGGLGAVVAVAAGIPGRIKGGMGDLGSYLLSAGAALMDGLKNGIISAASAAAQAAAAAAHSVAAAAKGALGVKSPSKVFEEIGRNVIRGLHNGLSGMGDTFAEDLKKNLVEPLAGAAKSVDKIIDGIHRNIEALVEAAQMTEEVGGLEVEQKENAANEATARAQEEAEAKVEAARAAAEAAGSPGKEGGAEITSDEQKGIEGVEKEGQTHVKGVEQQGSESVAAARKTANEATIQKLKSQLDEMRKEATLIPKDIKQMSKEVQGAVKAHNKASKQAKNESKKLRQLESKLTKAKTDAEKKPLKVAIKHHKKELKKAEKAAEAAEKLHSKLGERLTELRERLQELVGATGRGGAIFGTLMALAKLNAIPLSDLPKFAKGVEGFAGGPAEVGEHGPELVGHGIANLAKGVDVLDANMTKRLLGAHRKLASAVGRGATENASAPARDDGALNRLADSIDRLNETGTVDVLEALVGVVSERQGYKHLRGRRGDAGDGRVAIA